MRARPPGLEHAEELRQGGLHVGDVLIDLRDDGHIETAILKRQTQRVGLPERHVRLRRASRLGEGEHGRAFVHADNNSSFPHYPCGFQRHEAGACAQIEHSLTRPGSNHLQKGLALRDHVRRRVDGLHAPGRFLIETWGLTHAPLSLIFTDDVTERPSVLVRTGESQALRTSSSAGKSPHHTASRVRNPRKSTPLIGPISLAFSPV